MVWCEIFAGKNLVPGLLNILYSKHKRFFILYVELRLHSQWYTVLRPRRGSEWLRKLTVLLKLTWSTTDVCLNLLTQPTRNGPVSLLTIHSFWLLMLFFFYVHSFPLLCYCPIFSGNSVSWITLAYFSHNSFKTPTISESGYIPVSLTLGLFQCSYSMEKKILN